MALLPSQRIKYLNNQTATVLAVWVWAVEVGGAAELRADELGLMPV